MNLLKYIVQGTSLVRSSDGIEYFAKNSYSELENLLKSQFIVEQILDLGYTAIEKSNKNQLARSVECLELLNQYQLNDIT